MNFVVNNLLNISLGLNAKAEAHGEYSLVQAKDFTLDFPWDCNKMASAKEGLIRKQHILSQGDVLLQCKGKSFQAKCWDGKNKAVASSSYFILRIMDHKKIRPAYLAWFLNTSKIQEYLLSQSTGLTVKSIAKATVSAIEIPLCSIQLQKNIIEANRLWQEEKLVRKQLIATKNAWVEQEMFHNIEAVE